MDPENVPEYPTNDNWRWTTDPLISPDRQVLEGPWTATSHPFLRGTDHNTPRGLDPQITMRGLWHEPSVLLRPRLPLNARRNDQPPRHRCHREPVLRDRRRDALLPPDGVQVVSAAGRLRALYLDYGMPWHRAAAAHALAPARPSA